jgi:hypothetical protein
MVYQCLAETILKVKVGPGNIYSFPHASGQLPNEWKKVIRKQNTVMPWRIILNNKLNSV